jgi:hypothetical protein
MLRGRARAPVTESGRTLNRPTAAARNPDHVPQTSGVRVLAARAAGDLEGRTTMPLNRPLPTDPGRTW